MKNKFITIIFIGLFWAGNFFSATAAINAKDTTLFVGTIGPLFVVQSGINIQLTYQYSLIWSLDLEWGRYNTGSTSPSVETIYSSVGTSFFLKELPIIHKYFSNMTPPFFRISYSYHDEKNQLGRLDNIIGRNISNGIELSAGFRVTRSWYTFEFVPLSFYFPVSSKKSGVSPDSSGLARTLSFKVGVTF